MDPECWLNACAPLMRRFWQRGREQLWEEKLGVVERFRGNAATEWGTVSEEKALARCGQSCVLVARHTPDAHCHTCRGPQPQLGLRACERCASRT